MSKEPGPSANSVAIVGISCRLPGNTLNPYDFWELLKRGGETWTPVPPDRFNEEAFYHPSPDNHHGTNHHKGGHFISGDLRDFDHSFFRLSSQQAAAMDPQQRILLEMTYEALENAGCPLDKVSGTNTAVHVATFTADFERNLYKDPLDMPVYYITGTEKAILSNRISHAFDLHGPSVTIDTACSGGLVALHQACLSLLNGESDAAIVAAANLTLSPDQYIGMSNLHLISNAGRSYPFDHRGEGYGRGEGAVVLVVKRLNDALINNDPVQAVIRGTAVNQNGYVPHGIVHPNSDAQLDLIQAAYKRAGLDPHHVAYVEAHGTGTVAGDHEELSAITRAFAGPNRSLPLYVGSVKGNIGHTENVSGLVSVIKAALILETQVIPPVGGFEKLRPGLSLGFGIYIPNKPVPFPGSGECVPRVSINSFGFGGTNAHAVLERTPLSIPTAKYKPETLPKLFVFSANSGTSLVNTIKSYHTWLAERPHIDLWNLSYTLCSRRTSLPWRFSCVAHDHEALQMRLLDGSLSVPKSISNHNNSQVVFIFTGQGAQWFGMGRSLLMQSAPSPVFRDSIRASCKILLALGATWNLENELLSEDLGNSPINTAELAQPVTTAIQIALVTLLHAQGMQPQVVVGHSSGEIAAAFTAGYLSHQTALAVSFYRGFMRSASISRGLPRGGMVTVALNEHEIRSFTKDLTQGIVTTACINSPKSVTLSGDATAIDELTSRLQNEGVHYRRLIVDTAYHSRHMNAVADDYHFRIKDLDYAITGNRDIVFISSVSGEIKTSGFDSSYWVANLVSPVRFYDAVKTLGHRTLADIPDAHGVFIEIGPHPALSVVVRQCLENVLSTSTKLYYTSPLRRNIDAVSSYLEMIGSSFQYGVSIDPGAMFQSTPTVRNASTVSGLPSYSWDHSRKHWYESRLSREYRQRREPYHDLLGVRMIDSSPIEPRWRHMIDINTLPWLAHHVIDNLVIFPGSGYLCMVFEAMLQLSRQRYQKLALESIIVRNVAFLRALVVASPPMRQEMQMSFKPTGEGILAFEYSITSLTDSKWYEYCTGTVEALLPDQDKVEAAIDKAPRTGTGMLSPAEIVELSGDQVYAELSSSGNQYGQSFMGCKNLKLETGTSQTEAEIIIPDVEAIMPVRHQKRHLIHPTTLDVIFHTALPMAKRHLGVGSIVPVSIDKLVISANDMPRDAGKKIRVSTLLTSTRFRTSYVNMRAITGARSILSVSGMEMRSTAPDLDPSSITTETKDICYTLDWQSDVDLMRSQDFSVCTNLEVLFGYLCFKRANLSIVEFPGDYDNLSSCVLDIIDAQAGTVSSYTYIEPWRLEESRSPSGSSALDPRIKYLTLSSEPDVSRQSLRQLSYDVALITDIEDLARASIVVCKTGTILILIDKRALELEELTSLVRGKLSGALIIRLAYYDFARRRFVVAVQYNPELQATELPIRLRILTHSPRHSIPNWVNTLHRHFHCHVGDVTLKQMSEDAIKDVGSDTCFLVLDDCSVPMVSDPDFFKIVTSLLMQPARILWVCPSVPVQMYQITGLSRTAHAENNQLRLVTVHTAQTPLDGDAECSRLAEILTVCLNRMSAMDNEPQPEREYRIQADGMVLVPRLRRDQQLSRVIAKGYNSGVQTAMRPFIDHSRPLILSRDGRHGTAYFNACVDDTTMDPKCPRDHEVEIEARAIRLTNAYRTASLGVYAGTVTQIGPAVKAFTPEDRVVAVGTAGGLSRPRVSQSHVISLPLSVSFGNAAAFLVPILGACYALHQLARLESSGRVLVNGAMTIAGRAIVAVAQAIGARIYVLAMDGDEANSLVSHLCLPTEQVLNSRHYLYEQPSQHKDQSRFDIIVQAGSLKVPLELLAFLKPLGNIIVMESSVGLGKAPRIPRNATIHSFDIEEVFTSNPNAIEDTIEKARVIFKNLPTQGLTFCTRDVSQVAEAVHLLDTGVQPNVVLSSEIDSIAPSASSNSSEQSSWGYEDVSYIVAGGLGDIGRRLLRLMARRGAKHLVTLSRRVITDSDHQNLRGELDKIQPGCQIYCLSCDITSETDLKRIATTLILLGVPPVRGVIQSTAILQDRTLDLMTYDEFLAASQIKVDGTIALERVFSSPQLSFFMMLSSAVSIIGTSAQGNYNAGNTVQDIMAHVPSDKSCHFISLNIGWVEDAVAIAKNDQRLKALSRAGFQPITKNQLFLFLDHALGVAMKPKQGSQVVIGFSMESLSQASQAGGNGNMQSAMFRHVYNTAQLDSSSSSPDMLSFKALASNADQGLLLDFVAGSIANKLMQLISTDALRVLSENLSILELGLDSLVAIELRNWIMREFEAPLQSSEVVLDQTIRMLAEKVISRFRTNTAAQKTQEPTLVAQKPSKQSTSELHLNSKQVTLPTVPMPILAKTLQLFQESRRAIDSESDQRALSHAVTSFLHGPGPVLESKLGNLGSDIVTKNYEDQIYLRRREPLQDYSLFSIIHPTETPVHSQVTRAALLTVAAIEFAESQAPGTYASRSARDMGIRSETQKWLFYTTRRPETGVDQVVSFAPNRTIAVLRRGHVFQLDLGAPDAPLSLSAMESSYAAIMESSDNVQTRVCALTAAERDLWASLRHDLELDSKNVVTLSVIDKAAFVMCLDDEAPDTSGERLTQFLINGPLKPFSNRWLDKPVQLAVTANGVSGGIHEHSKIDGLDVRPLHRHLIRVLMSSGGIGPDISSRHLASTATPKTYYIKQFTWNLGSDVYRHLMRLEASFSLPSSPYVLLGHEHVKIASLGRASLRGKGVSPNASAQLMVILALFLVDGYVRAAWEIVSLAGIGGRIDWIQTVSPVLREFVEAAVVRLRGGATRADTDKKSALGHVRVLCREAARLHSKAVALTAQGHGYVNHLYALHGILSMPTGENKEIPAIFRTSAWNATRRGGTGQDVKIGFEPSEDEKGANEVDSRLYRWKEAGFLMDGDKGIHVHCDVAENQTHMYIMGRPKYAATVARAIEEAATFMLLLLEE